MTARDHNDAADGSAPPAPGTAPHYAITVQGHLTPRWSAWFDGLELTPVADGTTVISGPVADQAALHGLLERLRDLGIELLSLQLTGTPAGTSATDTERQ